MASGNAPTSTTAAADKTKDAKSSSPKKSRHSNRKAKKKVKSQNPTSVVTANTTPESTATTPSVSATPAIHPGNLIVDSKSSSSPAELQGITIKPNELGILPMEAQVVYAEVARALQHPVRRQTGGVSFVSIQTEYIKAIMEHYRELMKENIALKLELNRRGVREEEYNKAQARIVALENSIQKTDELHKLTVEKLEGTIATLQGKIAALQAENATLVQKIADLEKGANEVKSERQDRYRRSQHYETAMLLQRVIAHRVYATTKAITPDWHWQQTDITLKTIIKASTKTGASGLLNSEASDWKSVQNDISAMYTNIGQLISDIKVVQIARYQDGHPAKNDLYDTPADAKDTIAYAEYTRILKLLRLMVGCEGDIKAVFNAGVAIMDRICKGTIGVVSVAGVTVPIQ